MARESRTIIVRVSDSLPFRLADLRHQLPGAGVGRSFLLSLLGLGEECFDHALDVLRLETNLPHAQHGGSENRRKELFVRALLDFQVAQQLFGVLSLWGGTTLERQALCKAIRLAPNGKVRSKLEGQNLETNSCRGKWLTIQSSKTPGSWWHCVQS